MAGIWYRTGTDSYLDKSIWLQHGSPANPNEEFSNSVNLLPGYKWGHGVR